MDRRRAVLAGLAAGSAGVTASGRAAAKAATRSLQGGALYADVKAYAALGEHRTGTSGDAATTRWLAKALKAAGYAVEVQGFDYPVFEVGRTEVVQGAHNIFTAFPYWTPQPTPPGGVTGRLSLTAGPGEVALVVLPAGAGAGLYAAPPPQITEALARRPAAVIAVTQNPLGEMAALNRTPKAPPWPAPVVLAPARMESELRSWAQQGEALRVYSEGRTLAGRAENVIARKPGRGASLVVSTPKSGWFHCAGERGSGLAMWLGLARWLATTELGVVLLAASGHEFDGYGGKLFTETLAPKPADTALWVHIGANVAGYDFARGPGRSIVRQPGPPAQRLLAVSERLMGAAAKAFAGQVGYGEPIDIDKQKAPGEIAHFQQLGYAPLVGMVAASPLHHTRRDLPDVTGPELLEPVARSLASLIAEAT